MKLSIENLKEKYIFLSETELFIINSMVNAISESSNIISDKIDSAGYRVIFDYSLPKKYYEKIIKDLIKLDFSSFTNLYNYIEREYKISYYNKFTFNGK